MAASYGYLYDFSGYHGNILVPQKEHLNFFSYLKEQKLSRESLSETALNQHFIFRSIE